jgi:shikimate kinase
MDDTHTYLTTEGTPVFLVGFMGSGKSTIGRLLARKLGYRFIDTDEEIEKTTGKQVSEIFAQHGEPEFRRLEREAIAAFNGLRNAVVSLGGGAYVPDENRTAIRQIGFAIWIDCPLELCWSRLLKDKTRPLLRSFPEMAELLESRRPAYNQVDLVVRTGSDSPARIAHLILEQLGV